MRIIDWFIKLVGVFLTFLILKQKTIIREFFWVEETISDPEYFTFKTKKYSENGVPLLNYQIDPRYKKVVNGALRDSRIPITQIDNRTVYQTAKWKDIIKVFNSDCKNLGVDSITAYNINFDFGVNG